MFNNKCIIINVFIYLLYSQTIALQSLIKITKLYNKSFYIHFYKLLNYKKSNKKIKLKGLTK